MPLVKLGQQIIEPFREDKVEFLLCSKVRGKLTGCRNYALFGEALRCVVFEEAILPHAAEFDELIKRAGHEELPTLE